MILGLKDLKVGVFIIYIMFVELLLVFTNKKMCFFLFWNTTLDLQGGPIVLLFC